MALAKESAVPHFTDVAQSTGIDFIHFSGRNGKFFFPEISGSGCAFLDYDDDGDLDVYLLQGTVLDPDAGESLALGSGESPGAVAVLATSARVDRGFPLENRLFRNEPLSSHDGSSDLRFRDVTEASQAGVRGYAQGVATGDVDNDGDVDLYVTNFGPDVLLRNGGNATFADASAELGLGDPRWTTSASFFDYDRDGFLDLFVAAYADYSVTASKACNRGARLEYCGPLSYPPLPSRLYRNKGGQTFENVSADARIDRAYGHGLGVAAADFDANGWQDVYVANDGSANQLWLNESGLFRDAGLASGCTVNHAGQTAAGMGVALGDLDEDGDADILVTNLTGETNTLYENLGSGSFTDRTTRRRLGTPSLPFTSFGVAWMDVDHDADLDLLVANGAVYAIESLILAGDPLPYHQTNQLLIQGADGTFSDRSAEAGAALQLSEVSRGLAVGDVDNDGDLDALISNIDGRVRLLRNDLQDRKRWLLLRVIDEAAKRDAYGASVRLGLSGGRVLYRTVRTDGSYCSACDARVHFAWAAPLEIESLEVALPGANFVALDPPEVCTLATILVRGEPLPSTRGK